MRMNGPLTFQDFKELLDAVLYLFDIPFTLFGIEMSFYDFFKYIIVAGFAVVLIGMLLNGARAGSDDGG